MNRRVFLIIAMLFVVGGGLGLAQSRKGDYGAQNSASVPRVAVSPAQPDANYDVSPYPSFTPEMADGEGKQEVQSFCAMCHSTRYITMQPPLKAAEWEAEVHKMVKVFGAPIPEPAEREIIFYLQEHYTPETRKQ